MITRDDITAKFKEILAGKPAWAAVAEDQFTEMLTALVGWAVRQASYDTDRAQQEFHAATALNRASILTHVESNDFLPEKATPATGPLVVANRGGVGVVLRQGTEFLADANQLTYTLLNTVEIPPGESREVLAAQYETRSFVFDVTAAVALISHSIDALYTPRLSGFGVFVDEGAGEVPWTRYRLLQNTRADTMAFDEFFSHTGSFGVRFGNGRFGKIPAVGSKVRIAAQLTAGASFLLQHQPLTPVVEILGDDGNAAVLDAKAKESISGGAAMQGVESMRKALSYWPVFNEDIVWGNDYVYYLTQRFPEISFIATWGEAEAEAVNGGPSIDFINKIWISAYSGDPLLGGKIEALFRANPGLTDKNTQHVFVPPLEAAWRVTVTGRVLSKYTPATVKVDILALLEEKFGRRAARENRVSAITEKELYRLLDSTGYFAEESATVSVSIVPPTLPPDPPYGSLNQFDFIDVQEGDITIGLV